MTNPQTTVEEAGAAVPGKEAAYQLKLVRINVLEN
jgi:hypothetical protein